jgi:hypothetical protein
MVRNLGILNVLLSLPTLVDQCKIGPLEVVLIRRLMIKKGIAIEGIRNNVKIRFIDLCIKALALNSTQ